MVEQTDFIDITPSGIDPSSAGSKGKKTTVFQDGEWDHIQRNPRGLTKEGVLESIRLWKHSANKHVVLKYETMLQRCKNFEPSGTTSDGKIILARKNGVPTWTKDDPNYVKTTNKKGESNGTKKD